MDLNQAIVKHSELKSRLRWAITLMETMDAETISKDNCCEVGYWRHGESKPKMGKLASHAECVSKHAQFHVEAGKVAKAINAKKYTEAEAMLNPDTPYWNASTTVVMAIMHLMKETGQ